jgi:GNAT superfamily N-acetyltransferase
MDLTFQAEPFSPALLDEMQPYFHAHWKEIALLQDKIPLDPDWGKYEEVNRQGKLHILTARDGTKLVGYHVAFIDPHHHYKSTLFATTDIFYLAPEYRKGANGIKLFARLEEELRKIGVKKMVTITKLHSNVGPIFQRLGWTHVENTFTKWLGD